MRNYIAFKKGIFFFDDELPAPLPPAGASVYKRPPGKQWARVPQILGNYDETPLDELDYHEDLSN